MVTEPSEPSEEKPRRGLIDKLGFRNEGAGRTLAAALGTLAVVSVIGFALLDNEVLRISLLIVVVVFWIALWLVIFISEDPSAKEIGVALLSGLIVAGAAFALNTVLTSALLERDTTRRQAETRLTMNRREQFSFRKQDMSGFDLSGMALNRTDTDVFDFSFANLTGANLSNAELRGAQLRQTILRDVDLTRADLTQASLRSADLTDANLSGANLSGADLTGVVGFVEPTDGDPVVLSEETRCPGDEQDGSGPEGPPAAPDADGRFTCIGENQERIPPSEERPYVAFLVSNDEPFGSVVGQVTTDHPDAGAIEYDIAEVGTCREYPKGLASHFAIDRHSGVVTIAKVLDDELLLGAENRPQPQFCVRLQGAAQSHITVHLALDDETIEIEPALTYLVAADTQDGSRIGLVQAPESWRRPSYSIEGDSSNHFEIDERTGVLSLNSVLEADSPPRLITVRIESGPDEKSTSLVVRVAVDAGDMSPATAALAQASPRHYLVEDGGVLDVKAGDGLLTPEQVEAGISIEITARPEWGSLDEDGSSGAFTYRHRNGSDADAFTYRTLEQPDLQATATVAVVRKTESDDLRATSEPGVAVASLTVLGAPSDSVEFAWAASSSQLFGVDAAGNVITRVSGEEIFEAGPWHELEVTVTDLRSGHSIPVPVSVGVAAVVDATTSLSRLAAQVCPDATSADYVEKIATANRLASPTAIDPGDVLTLPEC